MYKRILLSAGLAASILSGCANHSTSNFGSFQADDLNEGVRSGALVQKTENFFVINDSSSSMSETYHGAGLQGQPAPTKFAVEKEILHRMNRTIPDLKLNAGIRSFGFGPCLAWQFTRLNLPVGSYSKSTFDGGIDSMQCSGGGTPMSKALNAAGTDLSPLSGNIAAIVLSDGNSQEGAVSAAQSLKEHFGDKLCIYTIWVGNDNDAQGMRMMQKIADISGCGFATTAGNVASHSGMADFVRRVFLTQGAAARTEGDDDGDGVPNSIDRCPHTPKGATVDKHGCWIIKGIRFDTDKSNIKPEFLPLLDNAVTILKNNPGLRIEVQGHTDNVGSAKYNQGLSERRAKSVRDYLAGKTGHPEALTSRGFGLTLPIDTNNTEEGRYNNRRVQLKILNGQYD
ncbi:MAG: OmpA family protein [Gammaproteobacteria bacterium]